MKALHGDAKGPTSALAAAPEDGYHQVTNGPRFVVLMGPCCSGKTTIRRERYTKGFIVLDAGDIFRGLDRGEGSPFPGPWREAMDDLGRRILAYAIGERRNLVTEVIGCDFDLMMAVVERVEALGYAVEVCYVHAPLEDTLQRNLCRDPRDLSAYLLEGWHYRWILGLN